MPDESQTAAPKASENEQEWKLPRSDVCFAFGPEMWYFARCGGKWRYAGRARADNDHQWAILKVNVMHWVAFKHHNGYVFGGEHDDGTAKLEHRSDDTHSIPVSEVDAYVESRNAYNKLYDWIQGSTTDEVAAIKDVTVTIGPNGSYFARCVSSWISHALPVDLTRELEEEKGKRTPAQAALGIDGSWIVLYTDRTRRWDLKNKYPSLQDMGVLPHDGNPIIFAALNPYKEDRYFITSADGSIGYSTSLADAQESQALNELTNEYMQARARKDGTQFSHPYTQDGVVRNMKITRDVYAVEGNRWMQYWKERRAVLMKKEELTQIGSLTAIAAVAGKLVGGKTGDVLLVASSIGMGAAASSLFRG